VLLVGDLDPGPFLEVLLDVLEVLLVGDLDPGPFLEVLLDVLEVLLVGDLDPGPFLEVLLDVLGDFLEPFFVLEEGIYKIYIHYFFFKNRENTVSDLQIRELLALWDSIVYHHP